jgi:hypothetical protein
MQIASGKPRAVSQQLMTLQASPRPAPDPPSAGWEWHVRNAKSLATLDQPLAHLVDRTEQATVTAHDVFIGLAGSRGHFANSLFRAGGAGDTSPSEADGPSCSGGSRKCSPPRDGKPRQRPRGNQMPEVTVDHELFWPM